MDGLEQEFGDRAKIIRVNLQQPVGRQVASLYGVEFMPAFILFDAEGNELWRQIGGLDPDRVRDAVK